MTVKNQHIIPRCYLEKFTDNKGQCQVYNKLEQRHFSSNPQKILKRNYFYDFDFKGFIDNNNLSWDGEIADKQVLEQIFSKIEHHYKKIQLEIEKNPRWLGILTNRFLVYQLIAIQFARLAKGKQLLKEFYLNDSIKDYDETVANIFLLREIINTIKSDDSFLVEYLLSEYSGSVVLVNDTDIPFVTSDTPTIRLDKFDDYFEDILFYPLTPTRGILLFKYRKNTNDIKSLDVNPRQVFILNQSLVVQSDEYIVSNKKILFKNGIIDLCQFESII